MCKIGVLNDGAQSLRADMEKEGSEDEFREDIEDIVFRLRDIGDATGTVNASGASVVRAEGEFEVSFVAIEELLEESHSAVNALLWIERIQDSEFTGSGGHQLHQSLGPFGRDGAGPEGAFPLDDGVHQILADAFTGCGETDHRSDLLNGKRVAGVRERRYGRRDKRGLRDDGAGDREGILWPRSGEPGCAFAGGTCLRDGALGLALDGCLLAGDGRLHCLEGGPWLL